MNILHLAVNVNRNQVSYVDTNICHRRTRLVLYECAHRTWLACAKTLNRKMISLFSSPNIVVGLFCAMVHGQSRPKLSETIKQNIIEEVFTTEPHLAATAIRLSFHDCVGKVIHHSGHWPYRPAAKPFCIVFIIPSKVQTLHTTTDGTLQMCNCVESQPCRVYSTELYMFVDYDQLTYMLWLR